MDVLILESGWLCKTKTAFVSEFFFEVFRICIHACKNGGMDG
jgi:hypothetical protein